jgi:hypothetical protein
MACKPVSSCLKLFFKVEHFFSSEPLILEFHLATSFQQEITVHDRKLISRLAVMVPRMILKL